MFDVTEDDPLSPAMHALLQLFSSEFSEVKFPDMDCGVLEAEAERVKARAEALAQAQTALDAARAALHEGQEVLLQKGQRALAYMRIFAEEHPALSQKLEGISLPRPVGKGSRDPADPTVAPKRRGRPPKALGPSASLFNEARAAAEPLPSAEP